MKVTLALLAEYATVEDDGKLHILGAGLDRLQVSTFPFVQAHIALVVKIAFESSEWARQHVIQIRFLDPGGNEVRPQHAFAVSPQPPPEIFMSDDEDSSLAVSSRVSLPVVHNMRDVLFERPGQYAVSVVLPEGRPSTQVPLEVIGPLQNERSLSALLNAGFRSFVVGDLEGAWAIFDQTVRTYPDSPAANNDLGFVSLTRRRPGEALQSFERARELGFDLTELTAANIACCKYLLGAFEDAFAGFRHLLGEPLQNSPSVLYAIDRNELHPIQLTAAVHFISLMALNAGASALRTGAVSDALQFAQIATAGTMTFTEEKDSSAFVIALDHLMADCLSQAPEATSSSQQPAEDVQGSPGTKASP
jgi:hypothetical protein